MLGEMNEKISSFCVKFGIREEYAIEYLEQIQQQYVKLCGFDPKLQFVDGDIIKQLNRGIMTSFRNTFQG